MITSVFLMEPFSVTQWLSSFGGDRHVPQFTDHGYVTLKKCAALTEEELIAVGIDNKYDRRRLLREVGELVKRRDKPVSA